MRSRTTTAARAVGILVLALVFLPLGGGTAGAHGGALHPMPSVPRILGLDPPVPGLTVTVVESGARLRIDNGSRAVVAVAPPGAKPTVEPIVPPGGTGRWPDLRIDAAATGEPPSGGVLFFSGFAVLGAMTPSTDPGPASRRVP